MPSVWRKLFRQMKQLGKMMVEDDIHDLGLFDYYDREGHRDHPSLLHHWQYGVALWYFSELLSLIDFFFPFEKQLEKTQLRKQIQYYKQLQEREKKKNAQQQMAQDYLRTAFRGIRRRDT